MPTSIVDRDSQLACFAFQCATWHRQRAKRSELGAEAPADSGRDRFSVRAGDFGTEGCEGAAGGRGSEGREGDSGGYNRFAGRVLGGRNGTGGGGGDGFEGGRDVGGGEEGGALGKSGYAG